MDSECDRHSECVLAEAPRRAFRQRLGELQPDARVAKGHKYGAEYITDVDNVLAQFNAGPARVSAFLKVIRPRMIFTLHVIAEVTSHSCVPVDSSCGCARNCNGRNPSV